MREQCAGRHLGLTEVTQEGIGGNCITRNFLIGTARQIFFGWSSKNGWDWLGM